MKDEMKDEMEDEMKDEMKDEMELYCRLGRVSECLVFI